MKKTILITILVVLAFAALGVGVVFAQGTKPFTPIGMGWMHRYMEQALASKLGLSEEQVNDQFAAGKTMYQIALDNGTKQEELANFIHDLHKESLANAVRDGVITEQQADRLFQRMQTMFQNGYGAGNCPMHSGQGAFQTGRGYGPGMMQNGAGMMGDQGARQP